MHKYLGLLNIAYAHTCKCSFSYFSLLYATKLAIQYILIIQYDVCSCAISIFNKVEYLDKEGSYINSIKKDV